MDCAKVSGVAPRTRGFPYNPPQNANSLLIEEKLRKDARARQMFVGSTRQISIAAPINATPTATVGEKNPDREISSDHLPIEDMRRVNIGPPRRSTTPLAYLLWRR